MFITLHGIYEQGHTGTYNAARFGTSSEVVSRSSSAGGLFSWLTGERSIALPPLDFPLENVSVPPSLPDYVEPRKTKITTLANGVKIASETSSVRSECYIVLKSWHTE